MSREWDEIYAAGRQMTRWPWTDLVTAVKRHTPDLRGKRVLELGCGAGANIPFFVSEDARYVGMEQSGAVLEQLRPHGVTIVKGNFTEPGPTGDRLGSDWDLICDRAAVTHNDTASIKRCLDMVFDALKPGGWYIGIDWFSTAHYLAHMGNPIDTFTRTEIPLGQFKGVGPVHFSNASHMMELFHLFEIKSLAHKVVVDKVLAGNMFASWNIVAKKPE